MIHKLYLILRLQRYIATCTCITLNTTRSVQSDSSHAIPIDISIPYTVKPVLRYHLCDNEKVSF